MRSIWVILFLIVIGLASGCSSLPKNVYQSGKASWYGKRFHGRRTASGERYDMNAMTAAHRTLKFGTRVRVKSKTSGKAVIVRINDRGPFIAGRIIDLSKAAAKKLGIIVKGYDEVYIIKL